MRESLAGRVEFETNCKSCGCGWGYESVSNITISFLGMLMNLIGIDKLVFGVEDMALCKKFWLDWGLTQIADAPNSNIFETVDKSQVEIRPIDDPSLPPPVVEGSTVRETVWAAADQGVVGDIAAELAKDRDVTVDDDGTVHALDPEGYGMGFRVAHMQELPQRESKYNAPGRVERVDEPAVFYDRATPQNLVHAVFHIQDIEGTPKFYMDRLGFLLTDAYVERGAFLRCGGANDHHNLFMFKLPGQMGFHHTAFELRDIHEVFGGGLRMKELGWNTHLGPGRHNVTSAYYWYFRNPCGGAAEYGFDTDRVTKAWVPREIVPSDGAFAEWSLEEGLDRFAGLQRQVEEA